MLLQRAPGAAKALRAARGGAQATDPVEAAAAAQLAIDNGHRSGDPRYFGQAAAVLKPWWTAAAPPTAIRLLRATLRQQRHDFAGALVDLDAVIAAEPGNAQAHLVRANVQLVLGEPDIARRDCGALITRADFLVSATCLGTVSGLSGQARSGLEVIETALAREPDAAPTLRIWAHTQAAEIAERLGDVPRAAEHYATALSLAEAAGENDVYLKAAHADFLLAQQRADEVRSLLAAETDFDALLLRLAMAETQAAQPGDAAAAGRAAQLDTELQARFDLAGKRNDPAHRREQTMAALYVNSKSGDALALARSNWQEQREPADARLLLQAALNAKDKASAAPVLTWMQRTKIEDVRLKPLAVQIEALP